jgi:hypothetical protein
MSGTQTQGAGQQTLKDQLRNVRMAVVRKLRASYDQSRSSKPFRFSLVGAITQRAFPELLSDIPQISESLFSCLNEIASFRRVRTLHVF